MARDGVAHVPRPGSARHRRNSGASTSRLAPGRHYRSGDRGLIIRATDEDVYAARANRVVVRESRGKIVSVIEIVSPGNKSSRHALRTFVDKAVGLLGQGISLLVIDLISPSSRDPQGLHKLIWDEIREEPFELPEDKRLTLAAYSVGPPKTAYVEPVAVGDVLPAMPAFLEAGIYVLVPLEQSYQSTWAACPDEFKEAVQ